MFRDKEFRKSAPIEEGQELELTIEAVGEKGDGIAKSKGFVIFVPGAKEGEHVKVRVTKVLRNFGFGEVIGAATGAKEAKPAAQDGDDTDSDGKGGNDNGDGDDSDEDNGDEGEVEESQESSGKDSEEF